MGNTIGFIGTGDTTEKNVRALLDDFVGDSNPRVIMPIAKGFWGNGMDHVINFFDSKEIGVEAITDERSKELYRQWEKNVTQKHLVQRIPNKLMNLLEKEKSPILIVIWDDEDEDAVKVTDEALALKIPVYDLTQGLIELAIEDDVIITSEEAKEVRAHKKTFTKGKRLKNKDDLIQRIFEGVMKEIGPQVQRLIASSEKPQNGSSGSRKGTMARTTLKRSRDE